MKWIVGIIIAAAIAAGVWYYYYTKKNQPSSTSQAPSGNTTTTDSGSASPQLGTNIARPVFATTSLVETVNLSGATPGNVMAGYGAMSGATPPASQGTVTISPVVFTPVGASVPTYTGGLMPSHG